MKAQKRHSELIQDAKTKKAANQDRMDEMERIRRALEENAEVLADNGRDDDVQIIHDTLLMSAKNGAASSAGAVADNAAVTGSGRKRRRSSKDHPNGSGASGGHISPAVAAARQLISPAPTVATIQPDFSKLIHTLEIDAVRRNIVGVRPQQVFKQYDATKRGEYNTLMRTFDSAFGAIPGITGNEKVTELSAFWFGGAAKEAINAAKPTTGDPNGDASYAEVRSQLDSIYGQDVDSAADALARLKEGGAVTKDNLIAYQDLYMNMLKAKSSALAVSSMELLDRRTSLLEIVSARMPMYMEKFFENYEQGDGFQGLLDFVLARINLLKIIQTSSKPQRTKTETREIMHQHHHITDYQTQPPFEGCMYCKNQHDTSRCDKLYCLSLKDRVAAVSTLRLCYHCLRPGHNARSCPEKREVTCSICNRKGHVTLLHGRHLLHSPNDLPNRHRHDEVKDNDDDNDAKSDVEAFNESNEAEEENELSL